MRKATLYLASTLLLLSACASVNQNPNMDEPVSNETSISPGVGDYIPSPSDSNLTHGTAFIDSTELLTLESFPLQFTLKLRGKLPTPCNRLRISVSSPDADHKITVDVYSVSNPDEMCAQVLQPFDVNFPLGSFPAGKYSLWVNGNMVAEFQS